jgi:hypothetical protein
LTPYWRNVILEVQKHSSKGALGAFAFNAYKEADMNIRPYAQILRAQGGWVKQFDSSAGGIRTVCFEKAVTARRTLVLQLWGDGGHRVSFFHNKRMATFPTDFSSPQDMTAAIKVESRRAPAAPLKRIVKASLKRAA